MLHADTRVLQTDARVLETELLYAVLRKILLEWQYSSVYSIHQRGLKLLVYAALSY